MKQMIKTLSLFLLMGAVLSPQCVTAQGFTIGTYNLRYANHDDSLNGNGWGQRYPVLINMIRFHGFDIFGTQEGLYPQLQDMLAALPGYSYIGVGRDDGIKAGEHSAIFYRTDKFELLESGNFWLSPITDRPNKGWDAALPRICTWGKFREKGARFTFYMFNLHMDHIGVKARAESSKLILQKIKEFPKDIPVMLTGDFNVDQYNESYTLINQSGILRDAFELSPIKLASVGTFNGFNTDEYTDKRIDHIFVTKSFKVLRYGILTDTYRSKKIENMVGQKETYKARVASDHYPVMISIMHDKK